MRVCGPEGLWASRAKEMKSLWATGLHLFVIRIASTRSSPCPFSRWADQNIPVTCDAFVEAF